VENLPGFDARGSLGLAVAESGYHVRSD
jgi:hypothetical protein